MNIIEIRKVLIEYYNSKGTSGNRIKNMHDMQVYAIYKRLQKDIDIYIKNKNKRQAIYQAPMTERDYWTDKEWDDYAFEEVD